MAVSPRWNIRGLLVGLSIIVLTCLAPSYAQTTWTVCPQGLPWCSFNSIQQAINTASPGDTVFVQSGFYQDSLHIRKNIVIQGANSQQVIIQGIRPGWPAVLVSTSEPLDLLSLVLGLDEPITVTLQNLQLQGAPWVAPDEQCAEPGSDICPDGLQVRGRVTLTVNNLWVHGNGDDGVDLGLHPRATIQNSFIWQNQDDGIDAWLDVEVGIIGNTITGNAANGIKLQSRHQVTSWLSITGQVKATIVNNQITNNGGYGLAAQSGEEIVSCYGNLIQGNGSGPLSPAAWGRC